MNALAIYSLGFAEFLAGLLPATYTIVHAPTLASGSRVRFVLRNAIGAEFTVDIEPRSRAHAEDCT